MVFQPVTATDKVVGIGRRKIGKILALFFQRFSKKFFRRLFNFSRLTWAFGPKYEEHRNIKTSDCGSFTLDFAHLPGGRSCRKQLLHKQLLHTADSCPANPKNHPGR
jgi:hypothetical protein